MCSSGNVSVSYQFGCSMITQPYQYPNISFYVYLNLKADYRIISKCLYHNHNTDMNLFQILLDPIHVIGHSGVDARNTFITFSMTSTKWNNSNQVVWRKFIISNNQGSTTVSLKVNVEIFCWILILCISYLTATMSLFSTSA